MSVGKLCNVDDDDFEVLFKTFSRSDIKRERDYFELSISELWKGKEMKIVILENFVPSLNIRYTNILQSEERETYQRDLD